MVPLQGGFSSGVVQKLISWVNKWQTITKRSFQNILCFYSLEFEFSTVIHRLSDLIGILQESKKLNEDKLSIHSKQPRSVGALQNSLFAGNLWKEAKT